MNQIDCIYYINLDHRTDRKEQFLKEMDKLGVPDSKVVRIEAIRTEGFGILGCGLSHKKALTTFLESNHKHCIIFEDDFTFTLDMNYARFLLRQVFEKSILFDIVMLAGNIIDERVTDHDFIRKVLDGQTASAYLITREFAPKLVELLTESTKLLDDWHKKTGERKHEYCNDIYWKKLQPESNWYRLFPKLGIQRESYSDNETMITNYRV
jgi:GR25 family glycosyltransferase involved in LPS biosynthesis